MAKSFRFIIVPKVAHPWYDEVRQGAEAQAQVLSQTVGAGMTVEYLPPAVADTRAQAAVLEQAAASSPSGIALDPVDVVEHLEVIHRIQAAGIPIVLFDAPSPAANLTSVGNNFAEQGSIAANRLVQLIGSAGKVAVMQGCPTAPNHHERYVAQLSVLKQNPQITIIDGGTDHDDIETARRQAAAVLAAHPDLKGYLCCNASGPIGIASAVKSAGKSGKVKVVGMDGIRPILEAIKEGVIESSSATIPRVQGSMAILMLWQANLGLRLPRSIDTGIEVITQSNVDRHLAEAG
jgi:ribose transport system substrate-binding protein